MDNKKNEENVFHLHDGKVILDLKSLAKELRDMPNNIYEHHVNHHKNDFATWIKHSLNEHTLAEQITGYITRIELELKVLRHLVDKIDSKENLVKRLQEGKKAKKTTNKEIGDKKVLVKKENSKKVTIKKN